MPHNLRREPLPDYLKSKLQRLRKRKCVTLIAGLKSTGGIVLCADTEESNGIAKYSTEKLDTYVRDWCRVGFAGAGNYGDLIDTVVDCLKARLDRDKPATFEAIKRSFSEELNRLHDNELRLFPTTKPEDRIVELLIAVRPRDEENADLWASSATALHPVRDGYDVRGIGDVLRFVAKRLYRDDLTLMQSVLLCVYLLSVSKRYVANVSGESHILVLTSDGWLHKEPVKETELSETFLEYFDTVLSSLFLAYADTSLTESQFALKLLRFTELTKKLRAELSEQFTKHHIAWASSDPMYVGDPYRKLPDGASVMLGPVKADYQFFDHITVDDPDFRVNPSSPQHAGSKYPPVPAIEGWTITGAMSGKPRSPEKTKKPKKPGRKLRTKKSV